VDNLTSRYDVLNLKPLAGLYLSLLDPSFQN